VTTAPTTARQPAYGARTIVSTSQYATFEVADQLFGVEVVAVREVISFAEYTTVPLASPAVAGLFNLRGQVIPAVDLRVQLGLPGRELRGDVMNVIVQVDDESVSLIVDRIGDVVEIDDSLAEPPPETISGLGRDLVIGTLKLADRLMLALDVRRAIDTNRVTRHAEGDLS
jgi:purine-binding chemotaxis protein CheW